MLIVADDLIWASRLRAAAERAGAAPLAVRGRDGLEETLHRDPAPVGAIVDLGARTLDGVAAVDRLASSALPVLAVAQHDDLPLRKRALAAGAERVLSYRKMHADAPAVIAAWLSRHGQAPSSAT